ncbi:MAG: ubiquitin-like domain-containing protein [Lapillicoccus sp.]
MISRPLRWAAQGAAVTVVAVGALSMAQYDKAVAMTLDGETSSVHIFGSTVGDLLAKQNVAVGEHDLVQPAADAALKDGDTVVVRYGRKLTVTIDGKTTDYWTTATSVDAALAELGIGAAAAKLSVSRSEPLGRSGLALTITTPKNVTVTVDGGTATAASIGPTVADALQQLELTLGAQDRVSPAPDTALTEGLAVTVNRIEKKTVNETQPIAFAVTNQDDANLAKGSKKTTTKGVAGEQSVSFEETWVDGKLESRNQTGAQVTKNPVGQVVAVGTKVAAPAAPTTTAPPPSAGNTSGAGLNLANAAMWDKIAWCESGQRWNLDLGTGYYGGLQFLKQTWLSWHGDDFAPLPSLATREQQITVANRLYADLGLKPWTCKP